MKNKSFRWINLPGTSESVNEFGRWHNVSVFKDTHKKRIFSDKVLEVAEPWILEKFNNDILSIVSVTIFSNYADLVLNIDYSLTIPEEIELKIKQEFEAEKLDDDEISDSEVFCEYQNAIIDEMESEIEDYLMNPKHELFSEWEIEGYQVFSIAEKWL